VSLFLDDTADGRRAFTAAVAAAAQVVASELAGSPGPYAGTTPQELEALVGADVAPERPAGLEQVLAEVGEQVVRHSIDAAHRHFAAHLRCPPLIAACAADVIVAAIDQSPDIWVRGPTARVVERRVLDWLAGACGLEADAPGTFTSGAAHANLLGLVLARDRACARLGCDVAADGLPPDAQRFRIVCSDGAHAGLARAVRMLGLGDRALAAVDGRLDGSAALAAVDELERDGALPIAIVATAGTADLGTIDPIGELADAAAARELWLHVDASVAGALVTSDREGSRLAGLERADSIALDFHGLWLQPAGAGALLTRAGHEPAGDLARYAPDGPRRFDALRLYVALRVHGRRLFGRSAEALVDLAGEAARVVAAEPELQLAREPELTTLLFRYAADGAAADELNAQIRCDLLSRGEAVVEEARLDGRLWLKLTFANPMTVVEDVTEVLALVVAAGRERRVR
jgi:L-2,4-diaminobutyrate decarboxylase